MKILVLDTNLLLHGKFITEIKWRSTLSDQEISILVPYVVLKELDRAKYSSNTNRKKRARKLISFFKKYDNDEKLHNQIPLIISHKKINWSDLPSNYRELLDENETDHHILAEIIQNYLDRLDDVYLITADYTFLKYASELGIKIIDWLEDNEYRKIFTKVEEKKEKASKLPDLGLYFDDQIAKELTLKENVNKLKLLSYDDLIELNIQYDHIWQLENPGVIENLIKNYNEQLILINKHQEINLFVFNHCDHPYNDIDIHISATLENKFVFTMKELIKSPCKPIIPKLNVSYIDGIPTQPQKGIYYTGNERITTLYNLDMRIDLEKKGKHNIWKIIYHVDRLKHNTFMELHPLLLFIPDSYKTNRIQIEIAYNHEEIGTIKEQKRIINLL